MTRRLHSIALSLSIAAIAVAGAGATVAHADSTIGQVPLAATTDEQLSGVAGSPVFQGDAGAGYALASTEAGTVTSFSFLSGNANTGTQYALAVLAPADANGTNWTVTSVSAPVAVTAIPFSDTVNGPYPVSLPIAVGDRIGLEPIGTTDVPLEQVTGAGVRYFAAAVAPGQTAAVASQTDNNQLLPLQATISATPPPPPPPAPTPPVNTALPSITGTPTYRKTLTCNPGTWTGSPTYTYRWSQISERLLPGAKRAVSTTTVVASGQTYVVPDLPPGVSFACTVEAENAATTPGGGPTATSPSVADVGLIPALAPSFSVVYRTKHNAPSIQNDVGLGGTNVCRTGLWLHFPAVFHYTWYEEVTEARHRHVHLAKAIGHEQKLKITSALEQQNIFCHVSATNAAGTSADASSNVAFVPVLAPIALGPVEVRVTDPTPARLDPSTTTASPLLAGPDRHFAFTCIAPKFNRDAQVSTSWDFDFDAFPPLGSGIPDAEVFDAQDSVSGSTLDVKPGVANPDDRSIPQSPPSLNGTPASHDPDYESGEFGVRCDVTAKVAHKPAYSVTWSKVIYFVLAPSLNPPQP